MRIFAASDMDRWNFVRTAQQLAKCKTVTATASVLGVHRATVLRHIDALESELGVKLFQRNTRGYIPTEAGKDLMQVASEAEHSFDKLFSRLTINAEPLTGEFIITSMTSLAPMIIPIAKQFQYQHPSLQVQFVSSNELLRLEFGEAHLAVRAGATPDTPDYVAIPFARPKISLYAHVDYLREFGHPRGPEELSGHKFLSIFTEMAPKVPLHRWIANNINDADVALKSNDPLVLKEAILSAMGIGFMFDYEASPYAQLVELFSPLQDWEIQTWLVTHGDLHRSPKIQAFLKVLREMSPQDNAA